MAAATELDTASLILDRVQTLDPPDTNFASLVPEPETQGVHRVQTLNPPGVNFEPPAGDNGVDHVDRVQTLNPPDTNFASLVPEPETQGVHRVQTLNPPGVNFEPPAGDNGVDHVDRVQTLNPPDTNFASLVPEPETQGVHRVQTLNPPGVNFEPPAGDNGVDHVDRVQTLNPPGVNFEPPTRDNGVAHVDRVQTLDPPDANFEPPIEDDAVSQGVDGDFCGAEAAAVSDTPSIYRARKVGLVQNALTSAERGVFDGLWRIGKRSRNEASLPWIDVTVGLKKLRGETALALNSCRNGIRGLIEKKVIDVLQEQVSETCTGRTYRVYSFDSIRNRWKDANLQFILMKRGGGREFCTIDGNEIHGCIDAPHPGAPERSTNQRKVPSPELPPTGCKPATPYRQRWTG